MCLGGLRTSVWRIPVLKFGLWGPGSQPSRRIQYGKNTWNFFLMKLQLLMKLKYWYYGPEQKAVVFNVNQINYKNLNHLCHFQFITGVSLIFRGPNLKRMKR